MDAERTARDATPVSRRPLRTVVVLLCAGSIAGSIAGCGARHVESGDVATAVADQVEEQAGGRPDVRCPDDLEAEVGASARCSLTLDGVDGAFGVTVTVTSVEDGQAHFDVRVDDEPQK